MEIKNNNYLSLLTFVSLVLVSIYCISKVGYDINHSRRLTYMLIRLGSSLAFPLLLMIFGALVLNKSDTVFGSVKKLYKLFLPAFIVCNIVLGILILHYSGFNSFVGKITNQIWFIWIILSNILVIPILNEFIKWENESGIKYILALFFITSILWMLSVQFKFGMYYIDLVFFAEPLCFMVLGYYLDKKDFQMSPTKLFGLSLLIFLIVFGIRVLLVVKGINSWNSFFIYLYNDTKLQISVDPFALIEVSTIFLMFKSLADTKLSNLKIFGFYSKVAFSSILTLGVFCLLLSHYKFTSNWINLTLVATPIFLILNGIFLFILTKIPILNKLAV